MCNVDLWGHSKGHWTLEISDYAGLWVIPEVIDATCLRSFQNVIGPEPDVGYDYSMGHCKGHWTLGVSDGCSVGSLQWSLDPGRQWQMQCKVITKVIGPWDLVMDAVWVHYKGPWNLGVSDGCSKGSLHRSLDSGI